jgi:Pentapeptide repeats (9 copies)
VTAEPVVPWWADWPLCQAAPTGTPGCIGAQLDQDQPCYAHADDDARAAALDWLRDGTLGLEFLPGVEVTDELLAQLLAAVPTTDGRRVLRFADLRGARVQGTAGFDGASFGGAWFDWASFQGDAGFAGASFQRGARFGGASFGGRVRFDAASFGGDAEFRAASFHRDASFGAARFHGTAWFDQATFQGDADFRAASFHGKARFDQVSGMLHS